MAFLHLKIDNLGEFVVSSIIVGATLVKVLVELPELIKKVWKRGKKKEQSEIEPPTQEEVEVMSRDDFDKLMGAIQSANKTMELSRAASLDAMGCIGVISILLRLMEARSTEETMLIIESEIYPYLRHNEFPSKPVITAMFEQAIESARKLRKEQKNGLDSRPNN